MPESLGRDRLIPGQSRFRRRDVEVARLCERSRLELVAPFQARKVETTLRVRLQGVDHA